MICCTAAAGQGWDLLVSCWFGLLALLVVLYRFVAGRPLNGRPLTNCTYLHRGTVMAEGARVDHWWSCTRPALWWAALAGRERQAIRLGSLAVAGITVYGWFTHSTITALIVLSVLAGAGVRALANMVARREIERVTARPPQIHAQRQPVAVTATVLDEHGRAIPSQPPTHTLNGGEHVSDWAPRDTQDDVSDVRWWHQS